MDTPTAKKENLNGMELPLPLGSRKVTKNHISGSQKACPDAKKRRPKCFGGANSIAFWHIEK